MTLEESIDPPDQPGRPNRLPTLTIDWELYGRYLDDSDLPEAHKRLLIETLWSIVVSFVDLGFRLNPVAESCGWTEPQSTEGNPAELSVLECNHTSVEQEIEDTAAGAFAKCSVRRGDAN